MNIGQENMGKRGGRGWDGREKGGGDEGDEPAREWSYCAKISGFDFSSHNYTFPKFEIRVKSKISNYHISGIQIT